MDLPDVDLDRLVEDNLDAALQFAVRLTGDPVAAEDVVQDALVRVTRSWQTFRGESSFRTWLFRIVINVFRSRLRASSATEPLPEDLAARESENPARLSESRELGRFVAAAVSALPPRQREVFVLVTYEGLSIGEVAEILDISPANVSSTLHHARSRLRTALAPYLVEHSHE